MTQPQSASTVPMPVDLHGQNAGRTMTMQQRRRARRRWRRATAAGVGYLSTEERHELGRLLAGRPQ